MDELISEFITETSESLTTLDSELVKLEQDPGNAQVLSNIFRLVHTIKGTCGFLGLPRLEAVAHAGENVLGKIRDKVIPVSPGAISMVLESLDCVKMIVDYLGQHGQEPEGNDSELTGRLNAFAESGVIKEKASGAVPEPVQEVVVQESPVAVAEPESAAVPAASGPVAQHEATANTPKEREETLVGVVQAQSIRVNLDVLENLMQMVGELVLTRNQLLQIVRTRSDQVFAAPLQHLSHITSELQEGIMKTRMQPIENAWAKFPRQIRDLSHELGKKIELRMFGAETELDRQLLEMIKDPLTHMVRNSADHGLEMPDERRAAGKPETGVITLSAFHEGGHIIIEISDDGRGLNIARIKQKIVANGLATEAELATLSDQQIAQFIFRPGFSTAEKVTSLSGRGVGMDVVRTNIEKIGGTVELTSVMGKGSKFNIKIPLTLAIVSVLIVEASGERFALPQINVQELVRVGQGAEYNIEHINNAAILRLRGKLLPLISLAEVLGLSSEKTARDRTAFVAVCKVGGYNFGVIVDRVFDMEEIVVKPVSEILKAVTLYSGNTILGDGSIIMILDPNGLARATGEQEIAGGRDAVADMKQAALDMNMVNFLLFKAGKGAPKAVPLELVSRLEKIDMTTVEMAGDRPVVQYRDDLMRLRMMEDKVPVPESGTKEVIVFTYDGKTLGLVVDEIIDIVKANYDIKMATSEKGFMGSIVIEGKTTDIVDVSHLLRDIVGINDVEGAFVKTEKQYKLLLVEDSPFFRSLTMPFLVSVGYKVTAVASAHEALETLESKPDFDVIVTDVEMPEMDGFEFASICRGDSRLARIPIFAFTSTRNEQVMQKGKQVGVREVVLKTDRVGLLQAIASVLQHEDKETV
ncbi:MAG TPA: chemotaxis protein CheW [Rickettsiales bacterium]|nr:chemotaxis protein CheW [Rickettsiales bacterium]